MQPGLFHRRHVGSRSMGPSTGRSSTGRSSIGPASRSIGAPRPSMVLRSPYGMPHVRSSKKKADATNDPRMARVEAVLLLGDEPLNTRKISQLANLADGTEARTLIRRLNERYDRTGTAFRVEEVAGGFQLLTRRKFAGWLRRLVRTHVEARLSAPALETLAVAAYRQPVTRAEIESIRGVACDEMLRQLMERELLKIVGRSDDLGRPFLYGTTKRFLRFFGLRHLDELPRAAELRSGRFGAAEEGAPEAGASGDDSNDNRGTLENELQEESEVKIAAETELAREEALKRRRAGWADEVRAEDEDDDFEEEDDEDDDDEDEDEDDDEEEEDFDDDDFDDDWEEVDDEDEDEDDEDWDEDDEDEDDDDDLDDDDEEEEEEEDDDE
jgi:segregation and condensation protein B